MLFDAVLIITFLFLQCYFSFKKTGFASKHEVLADYLDEIEEAHDRQDWRQALVLCRSFDLFVESRK